MTVSKRKILIVIIALLGVSFLGAFYLFKEKKLYPLIKPNPPKVTFIRGKFLRYEDIGVRDKKGYVCVNSKQEFKQLIIANIRKFVLSSEIETRAVGSGEYLSIENYWEEYPEYFSFWPGDKAKALKCNYFISTSVLESIEEGKRYELGYFKQAINKESFNELIDFLISAKFVPTVPTEGFNFFLLDYSSKVVEKQGVITRTDSVVYLVENDVPPFESYRGEESHTYSITKKDGLVSYSGTHPYYPFK